jgi:uncharacterized protein with PIN domain
VRIIKRGIPPEQKSYNVICSHCKSELEVEQQEARPSSDQRDVGVFFVQCPVCKRETWFTSK